MPTPTYDLIDSQVLSTIAASVTFSSIPATYRDLVLVVDGSTTVGNGFKLFFNGDTGSSNYSYVRAFGNGSTTGSDSGTESGARVSAGSLSGDCNFIIQIMDYSATDKHKTVLVRGNTSSVAMLADRWANTAAINTVLAQVDAIDTFTSGSTFYLFGIAS